MIKNKLFKSTKLSLIRINIAVVSIFLMIFSISIFCYFKISIYNNIDNEIEEEAKNIINQIPNGNTFRPIVINDPRNLVYVYKDGQIRYYTKNTYLRDVLPKSEDMVVNEYFTYKQNGYTFRSVLLSLDAYDIHIIRSIESEITSLKQLFMILFITIILSLFITYFIGVYLTKKALIPIEKAWDNQVNFIQNASHEIRTPIAIILSKLEAVLRNPDNTITDEIENIGDAMSEARRMRVMVNDLLKLTRLDNYSDLNIEEININELIEEIYISYNEIAQIKERNININIDANTNIRLDKEKLKQLLSILIDNGFKYTNKGDFINISTYEDFSHIIIEIEDSGIGINEKELPFIFDRFYRSEYVRHKNIDGSGIGLSIAKMIAETLNIKIIVSSKINEGTKFKIIIKK